MNSELHSLFEALVEELALVVVRLLHLEQVCVGVLEDKLGELEPVQRGLALHFGLRVRVEVVPVKVYVLRARKGHVLVVDLVDQHFVELADLRELSLLQLPLLGVGCFLLPDLQLLLLVQIRCHKLSRQWEVLGVHHVVGLAQKLSGNLLL